MKGALCIGQTSECNGPIGEGIQVVGAFQLGCINVEREGQAELVSVLEQPRYLDKTVSGKGSEIDDFTVDRQLGRSLQPLGKAQAEREFGRLIQGNMEALLHDVGLMRINMRVVTDGLKRGGGTRGMEASA